MLWLLISVVCINSELVGLQEIEAQPKVYQPQVRITAENSNICFTGTRTGCVCDLKKFLNQKRSFSTGTRLNSLRPSFLRGGSGVSTDVRNNQDANSMGSMPEILKDLERPPAPDEDDLASGDSFDHVKHINDLAEEIDNVPEDENTEHASQSDAEDSNGPCNLGADDSSDPFRPTDRSLTGAKAIDPDDPRAGSRKQTETDRCSHTHRSPGIRLHGTTLSLLILFFRCGSEIERRISEIFATLDISSDDPRLRGLTGWERQNAIPPAVTQPRTRPTPDTAARTDAT
jgi:hypothetical protein